MTEVDSPKFDITSDGAKAAISEAVDKAVAGLKSNRDEVLREKKQLSESLRAFEGLDAVKVREMMANINKSEETRLIADGKLEDVWALRSTAMQKHYDTEIVSKNTKITDLTKSEIALQSQLADLKIDTVLRSAASKLKLLPAAVDDAIFLGRSMFKMQKDGSLNIVDKNGFVQPGTDGKTPIQPEEWLQGLKDVKPHWWAQSGGVGATGGAGGSENNNNLSRDRFDQLSQGGRSKFISGGGTIT